MRPLDNVWARQYAENVQERYCHLREREKNALLREALTSQERSVELARTLYNAGEEDFLSVLDAERELINVEDQWVSSETLAIFRLITLYSALGGGWEAFEAEPPPPAP